MINPVPIQNPVGHLDMVLWQWQSDPNPWAERDPAKWTWQNYSDADCLILEKAFSLNQEVVNLKDYEVDFKRMLQVNKQFRDRIRRVRRNQKSRFLIEIPKPAVIIKDQKTMNEAFGTIQHFLDYIMKRTPMAYGLYQRLKELSLDCQATEFEDLIQGVIECIEKGAETREKMIKTRTGSKKTSFIAEGKKIIDIIKQNSASLRDFLKAILKTYTMETFICYWLNELLRSEDWEEINVLTPYLVCLVYTFKLSEYIIKYQKPQKFRQNLIAFINKPKLLLYRGAALKKEHLELYDLKKIKYFSWNGVTSTSREKNVALKFVHLTLATSEEPKIGVLFSIETDFASIKDCEGMIDVSQGSQYPDEQEIILAPGMVFKLRKTCLLEKNIYEVNLKIKRKIKTKKVNKALLGNLQDKAISLEKAVIDGLPSKSSKLLELVRGNKLIGKLKITNSELDEHLMEEIENVRLTTDVKRSDMRLKDNVIIVSSIGILAHYFSEKNLDKIFSNNEIRFQMGTINQKDEKIKELILSIKALEEFRNHNQLLNLWKNVKSESQITDLDISLTTLRKNEISDFLHCLKELKNLKNLKLSFYEEQMQPKESLEFFFKMIGSRQTLNQLSLRSISSDEGLLCLEKSLLSLVSMQKLSLGFISHMEISNQGLKHLKNGLISLKSLQSLSLRFMMCEGISDEVLNYLKDVLVSFKSLKDLSLEFSCCNVPDKGLEHLTSALVSLTSLQDLELNFSSCKEISDEGLRSLKNGLISLTSLKNLSLGLPRCPRISDEGLRSLKNGLVSLKSLQNLSLQLSGCPKISNQGLNHLKDALTSLTSLDELSLDFSSCNKISDEGLKHLKDGLRLLTSLIYLSIHFSSCNKISEKGLNYLKSAVTSLPSLGDIYLDFESCKKIPSKARCFVPEGSLF